MKLKIFNIFFLVVIFINLLESKISKELLEARNLFEKKGLSICERKYTLIKCILSIFFNKLLSESKQTSTELVSQSKISDGSIVQFINQGSFMLLTSDPFGRIYSQFQIKMPSSFWIIQSSKGAFVRIRNRNTKLYLQANSDDQISTTLFRESDEQEWKINSEEGIIINRKYSRILFGNLNGRIILAKTSDLTILGRWYIRLPNTEPPNPTQDGTLITERKLRNGGSLNYLNTNQKGDLFVSEVTSGSFGIWRVIQSRGAYVKIQNRANKLYLDIDVDKRAMLTSNNQTSETQEWFFDENNKIINRDNFNALTEIDGELKVSMDGTPENLFQSWIK